MPQSSMSEDRESFMARVRAALGHERTQPVGPAPQVDECLARLAWAEDDMLSLFAERAEQVGMKVQRLHATDLPRRVLALLKELGVKRLVVGVGSLPQAVGIKDALRRQGYEIINWQDTPATPGLESLFDADAGITDVHAALAETGTLVCCSDAGHSRGLSLVPPVHVAIVRRSDILPDMLDYWARQKRPGPGELPSSIALITGPSKTADIEGELIVGVHGPGWVHVLLVEDA